MALALAVERAPASASAPPTLSGLWAARLDDYGPTPDFSVDCAAPSPILQWSIALLAAADPFTGEEDPGAPYHGSLSETGRSWHVGMRDAPPATPAVSDPQIRFELADADGLRFRGVESGPGAMTCVPWFDDEGHPLPDIADYLYSAAPTYMAKIYTSGATYLDRGTSALDWASERCCIYRRHFRETWQSSLRQAVPARHVSASASADRAVARGEIGSPPSDLRVRAHSSPTGENPVGSVRIRGGAQPFRGTVTCLEVLDSNVGLLARTAGHRHHPELDGGGALVHLQDAGTADRGDVTLLSAPDFARQQAVGCAPVAEPAGALTSGRIGVTDALP